MPSTCRSSYNSLMSYSAFISAVRRPTQSASPVFVPCRDQSASGMREIAVQIACSAQRTESEILVVSRC